MVKAYLRYEAAASFGVIASLESNITYDSSGKHLLSPALEKVGVWNVRQGVCTRTLVPSSVVDHAVPVVTSVAASLSSLVAVGYSDGSIRIWDGEKGTCEVTFRGHEGAVTVLRYNKSGSLLASGSKKNDVMLWDVVGESGLFRLRGHCDQVTDLVFLDSDRKLISSSKDKFLRVWDLETQHCIQIVGGHHSEIWSLDVDPEERYLVTGSSDPELRFFTIKHERVAGDDLSYESGVVQNGDLSNKSKWEYVKSFGEIRRESKSRVATVRFNKSGTLLACQVAGKTVDVFRLLDVAEAKRKAKRRLHRKKEKKSKLGEMTEKVDDRPAIEEDGNALDVTVTDVFKLLQTVRSSKKITSIAFSPITSKNSVGTLALSSSKNLLEFYSVENNTAMKTIELQGHRSILRHVALSADNSLLMTVSHEAVKFWNPSSCSCLRTVETDSGMCGLLIPNNKYALVGTESGKIEIIDIGSGTCMEVVEAHGHFIHSIVAIPGENGFITTSEDHDVKFWEYQIKQRHGESSKHLVVSNVRTMKMNDAVLVAAVSPDGKYIGVAIESRVQVFFMDTLKPYLPLYGHSLRVLCMDISSDGDLIVTGSSDKTLRIWGLDFGNCHRIIRKAHDTSIAAVRFVHNTHYLFSAGWDGLVKYWDADKFQHLLTLEGHHAQVRCLAVSSRGDFVVTGSMDMSIRRWDRTEEPFFLEEEKEKRQMQEAGLESAFENNAASKEELPQEGAVALPGTKTEETITSTDLLIDALDVAEVELKRLAEHEEEKTKGIVVSFQPNLIMQGLSPSEYVLHALSSIHQSDLEQTLLALPFSDALKLLGYLRGWCFKHDKVELVSRVATVLLQIHHHQLITTSSARPVLTVLKDNLHARVKECKDTLGFNLAAMDHLKQLMASKSDAPFRNAKSKILEIRLRQSKRITAREDTKGEKRKKKKPKKSDGSHAWT